MGKNVSSPPTTLFSSPPRIFSEVKKICQNEIERGNILWKQMGNAMGTMQKMNNAFV